jgi:hypothetical protein
LEEQELPGLKVARRAPTAEQKLRLEIEEYQRAQQQDGPLISQTVAARIVGLSRQRVSQLLEAGRLRRWDFFDQPYVSLPEIQNFKTLDRPIGRRISYAA